MRDWPKCWWSAREEWRRHIPRRKGVAAGAGDSIHPTLLTQRTEDFERAPIRTQRRSPTSSVCQGTNPADRAQFDITFERDTGLTGYMKLRLFVSTDASDDLDIFVGTDKLDKNGTTSVPIALLCAVDDGTGGARLAARLASRSLIRNAPPTGSPYTHIRASRNSSRVRSCCSTSRSGPQHRFCSRRKAAPDRAGHRYQPLHQGTGARLFPPMRRASTKAGTRSTRRRPRVLFVGAGNSITFAWSGYRLRVQLETRALNFG